MSETAQIIIVSVITVLTIVISLVGIQLVFILKDIRETIMKVNTIIEDTRGITSKLTHSTSSLSGTLTGIRAFLSLLHAVRGGGAKHE